VFPKPGFVGSLEQILVYGRFETANNTEFKLGSIISKERILKGLQNTTKGEVWIEGEIEAHDIQQRYLNSISQEQQVSTVITIATLLLKISYLITLYENRME
jgi:hypothetical protein